MVAVLLSAWLLSNMLVESRYTWLSSAIQRSDVLRTVDNVLPPVPSVFAQVQGFLASPGASPRCSPTWPRSPPPGWPRRRTPQADALAAAQPASTVKVLGQACGYLQEGSGFVVAPGLVVTNAHVVAGEPDHPISAGPRLPGHPVSSTPARPGLAAHRRPPSGPR